MPRLGRARILSNGSAGIEVYFVNKRLGDLLGLTRSFFDVKLTFYNC